MTGPAPGVRANKPERHGLIGPFSGRQLAPVLGIVIVAAVVLVAATPAARSARVDRSRGSATRRPSSLGSPADRPPSRAACPGDVGHRAPTAAHGRSRTSTDGRSASPPCAAKASGSTSGRAWCGPCQSETPTLRDTYDAYKDRGLEIDRVSVQGPTPPTSRPTPTKYAVGYTIAADLSADVLHLYRVYSLPTQVFIGPDGRIRKVLLGPVSPEQAAAEVEAIAADAGRVSARRLGRARRFSLARRIPGALT